MGACPEHCPRGASLGAPLAVLALAVAAALTWAVLASVIIAVTAAIYAACAVVLGALVLALRPRQSQRVTAGRVVARAELTAGRRAIEAPKPRVLQGVVREGETIRR